MPRLTTENLGNFPPIEAALTAGSLPQNDRSDGGTFDELLNKAAASAGKSAEVEPERSNTQPADDDAQPRSDPSERTEEGQETTAKDKNGSETTDTEADRNQPIEGEIENEVVEAQAASGLRQVVAEMSTGQSGVDEANTVDPAAEEESLQSRREDQTTTETKRSAKTASKEEASSVPSAGSKEPQDIPVRETTPVDATPVSEKLEQTATKQPEVSMNGNRRQNTDAFKPAESSQRVDSGGQPSSTEPAPTAPTTPRQVSQSEEKASRSERRQSTARASDAGSVEDQVPTLKAQNSAAAGTSPDTGVELRQATTDPSTASTASDTETGDSVPKPIQGGAGQTETGQPARSPTGQGTQAAPATESPAAPESGQVDRVQFVQRVARAFEAAASRNGSVRMRLHPPELGSLRLEIVVRNGTMTARLETETQVARNLLLDNLPALRDRLAQQDIKVQRFDVDLMDNSTGGSPRGPEDQSFSQDRPEHQASQAATERQSAPEDTRQPRTVTRPGEGTRINVVI